MLGSSSLRVNSSLTKFHLSIALDVRFMFPYMEVFLVVCLVVYFWCGLFLKDSELLCF